MLSVQPCPSLPSRPSPHVHASPLLATAAEWLLPAATAVTAAPSSPSTAMGRSATYRAAENMKVIGGSVSASSRSEPLVAGCSPAGCGSVSWRFMLGGCFEKSEDAAC